MSKKKTPNVEESSGNVFADLGLANPDELLAKADLVRRIDKIIHRRKLSDDQTAAMLEISKSDLSELLKGDLDLFSMDQLFRFLNALDQDVEIVIRPKRKGTKEASTCVVAN